MSPRTLVVAVFFSTGCSAFSMAGPAHFKEPATRAADLLRPSTTAPKFETELSAEAIADVRPLGAGFLVDLIAEEGEEFGAGRACGEVVLLDAQSGIPRWHHPRKGRCTSGIVTRERTIVTIEERAPKTTLVELDAATGNVLKSAEGGRVVALAQAADLFVLEAVEKERSVVAYGDGLVRKWSTPVTATNAVDLVLSGDTLYAYGDGVVAIDAKTGRASKPLSLGAPPQAVTVVPHKDGLILTRVGRDSIPQLTALGLDGAVRWNAKGKTAIAADADGILLAGGEDIAFVDLASGAERWKAKVSGGIAGRAVFTETPEHLLIVPQGAALTAFVAATGAVRWTVPILAGEPKARHTDQVIVGDNRVVWDTWRHVVGIDASGAVSYAVPVRSLAIAHREGRAIAAGIAPKIGTQKFDSAPTLAAALNAPMYGPTSPSNPSSPNGTSFASASLSTSLTAATAETTLAMQDAVNAMGQAKFNALEEVTSERRQASFKMTQRYAAASVASDYVVRPIAWNLGRGFLLVRKSDGAFTEIVTGPSDVFEGSFREPSMTGFNPGANVLVTFSEGFATDQWKVAQRMPVELVKRHVVGFAIDPAAWKPAATYAKTSKVPDGSFLWESDYAK